MTDDTAAPGRFDHWFSTAKCLTAIAIIAVGTYAALTHFAPG